MQLHLAAPGVSHVEQVRIGSLRVRLDDGTELVLLVTESDRSLAWTVHHGPSNVQFASGRAVLPAPPA